MMLKFSDLFSWIIYFSVLLLGTWISYTIEFKNKNKLWMVLIVVLSIVPALRYQTGNDWGGYETIYSLGSNANKFWEIPYNVEMSFKFIAFYSKQLVGSSLLLFSVYSVLTNLFFVLAIKNLRNYCSITWSVFSYICLLYFVQINLSRQMLAVMIVFWGFTDLYNLNRNRFILKVLVASVFHRTAILCIAMYFLTVGISRKKYRNLVTISLVASELALVFASNYLISLLYRILGMAKYLQYQLTYVGIGFGILIEIVMALFVFFHFTKKNKESQFTSISIRIFISAFILFVMQYFLTNFGGRMYYYFAPVEIVLCGTMLKNNKNRLSINAWQLLLICFLISQFIYSMAINSQLQIPLTIRL